MKVDLSQHITDFKGQPVVRKLSAEAREEIFNNLSKATLAEIEPRLVDEDMTLESVILTAANAVYHDEQSLSDKVKGARYKICVKAALGGEQDFSSEEITEIKKVVAKMYTPMVMGRTFDIIDPETKE